jgi:hypothetical protein
MPAGGKHAEFSQKSFFSLSVPETGGLAVRQRPPSAPTANDRAVTAFPSLSIGPIMQPLNHADPVVSHQSMQTWNFSEKPQPTAMRRPASSGQLTRTGSATGFRDIHYASMRKVAEMRKADVLEREKGLDPDRQGVLCLSRVGGRAGMPRRSSSFCCSRFPADGRWSKAIVGYEGYVPGKFS